jgi:hypothetical protein
MTTLTHDEASAQLRGAVTALDALLRPAVKSIDSLADRPHSKIVREALVTAAEHVRIACVLLEATADTAEPHRDEYAHELDERALAQRTRQHAL